MTYSLCTPQQVNDAFSDRLDLLIPRVINQVGVAYSLSRFGKIASFSRAKNKKVNSDSKHAGSNTFSLLRCCLPLQWSCWPSKEFRLVWLADFEEWWYQCAASSLKEKRMKVKIKPTPPVGKHTAFVDAIVYICPGVQSEGTQTNGVHSLYLH